MTSRAQWLRRHPLLGVEWLALCNRARRWQAAPGRPLALVVFAVLVLASLLLFMREAGRADRWLNAASDYWPIVLAVATLYVGSGAVRRRRRFTADQKRSWLAAAPISARSLQLSLALHVLAPAMVQTLLAVAFVAATAWGNEAVGRVIAALSGGALLGAASGWFGAQRRRRRYEASRYAPRAAASLDWRASSAALSHWPIAQAFAWGRPENSRTLLLTCLLLGVQAGTSALHGLFIVALWLFGGYLTSLLLAVPQAAKAAAHWLRSTPVAFMQFAWAVARRAILHQVIGVLIAALGFMGLGMSLSATVYLGALWLSVVMLVYALSVAEAYRGRSPAIPLALSLATLAAVESRAHAWSMPAVVMFTIWRLRGARQ